MDALTYADSRLATTADTTADTQAVALKVHCRPARLTDAQTCAALIFESGVKEFSFFLGVPEAECVAFLRVAFASGHGRFSWRRHHVATAADGTVLAVMAVHDGRSTWFDDPHVAWMIVRHFGFARTIPILLRGLTLESELPAPKRSQSLIAHCATHESTRGNGVFSALFGYALGAGLLNPGPGRALVLDVLKSNERARGLYERLGFVALPRARKQSRRLPAALDSVRMRFEHSLQAHFAPLARTCMTHQFAARDTTGTATLSTSVH
ncbi:GCN5-related N-acetyltransferase [Burkholderia sp. BT03]|nr:GCN5-related N-acetyltransferase [Burkholderia sp. BT03]SKC93989.1 Acetyltransferase (GNAT) family protein [Paraburkholderia hospita]